MEFLAILAGVGAIVAFAWYCQRQQNRLQTGDPDNWSFFWDTIKPPRKDDDE